MDQLQLIRYYDNETLQHIKISIIDEMAMHWKEIAEMLGYSPDVIMKLSSSGRSLEACLKEIIHKWMANASAMLNAHKYPCTWRGIHSLLLDTRQTSSAYDLKDAIEATYSDIKKNYDDKCMLSLSSTY